MRLVDADKLIEICRKGWKLFGREDEKLKHWVDEYDINAQPTVKAIPIEWIKKWAKFVGAVRAIDVLLEDWEKEKALDKQIEKWEIDDDVDWQTVEKENE